MKKYLMQKVDTEDPQLVSVIDDLPLWSAPFGLKLLDIIPVRRGMRVLDVGGGPGRFDGTQLIVEHVQVLDHRLELFHHTDKLHFAHRSNGVTSSGLGSSNTLPYHNILF